MQLAAMNAGARTQSADERRLRQIPNAPCRAVRDASVADRDVEYAGKHTEGSQSDCRRSGPCVFHRSRTRMVEAVPSVSSEIHVSTADGLMSPIGCSQRGFTQTRQEVSRVLYDGGLPQPRRSRPSARRWSRSRSANSAEARRCHLRFTLRSGRLRRELLITGVSGRFLPLHAAPQTRHRGRGAAPIPIRTACARRPLPSSIRRDDSPLM